MDLADMVVEPDFLIIISSNISGIHVRMREIFMTFDAWKLL